MTYDPLGRLWQTSGTSNGTTQFLYDGDALVLEYDAAGTMLKRYVHSDGEDDPLVEFDGASTASPQYLFADHLGSIFMAADANGIANRTNRYDEYGIPGAGNAGRFQYTGQAWLPDLGMYYYKARIYSPTLGRFMQTDPIGYKDQMDLYAYVKNDPVDLVDPDGTDAQTFLGKVAAKAAPKVLAEEAIGGGPEDPIADVAAVITIAVTVYDVYNAIQPRDLPKPNPTPTYNPEEAAGHKKGARPSTREKHQGGDARRQRDQKRNTTPTPAPKNPSTYPPKTSPDYLRPGPKPKSKSNPTKPPQKALNDPQ